MGISRSAFGTIRYLVLLLLQYGFCFIISKTSCFSQRIEARFDKINKVSSMRKATFTNPWSYLKKALHCTIREQASNQRADHPITHHLSDATYVNVSTPKRRNKAKADSPKGEDSTSLSTTIYSCSVCGDVFPRINLLDHHQAIKHAVSQLTEEDSARNIVQIIFQTSWMRIEKHPQVSRILKIHNSPKILNNFEEYRERVKARASRSRGRGQQRCMVDGNELLRFYCTTFACHFGYKHNSSLCNKYFCSICGIIRCGFSSKLDGICTYSSSDRAHASMPDDVDKEFSFMNVERAILICRVIAGRVAYDQELDLQENYDSVAGHYGENSSLEELYVFSPRAVLPCFVIIYMMY